MNNKTVSIHYINALVKSLERHGHNADEFLKKFDITQQMLTASTSRVLYEVFVAFSRYTWKILKDESFGFSEKPLPNDAFYYGSKLAINSKVLGEALQLLIGFYNYIEHGYKINLVIYNDDFEIQVVLNKPELDIHHMLAEFVLCAMHRFSCWLTGKPIEIKMVEFNFPPPFHQAEYALLFSSSPKRFNSEQLSIRFSAKHLNLPIIKNNLELDDYMAVIPMNILLNPVEQDNYTTKIKRIIESYQGQDFPNFDWVSQEIHMVPKTLRQKLKSEGVTYQKIKDAMRRDRAIYLMYKPNYTMADIAEKLGFTETCSFVRAFKGWTDFTPGAYRAQFIEEN
ncbi:AraC family transcriptional regulator ligand-binding domain-containing protein [Thalassotalea psychrophila]|uniref:AraC family transcriptional regulator ligand-binding domain-containing protein n=1 Tax=Thalassotalea psychrophila TaxID=3065647 RepID=A0ABY9U027_9GAMM|nr:AraC family transcriptional regulator ligand-binding domain-containing protein [Colwelliaceae bacterium SQ149]